MIKATHCEHVIDTEHEAYRVENIRFAGAIKTSYGVERRVPSADLCPVGV